MRRLLDHIRRHLVAYLALFVALGGTSYAAATLPNGSVTAASLNTHSIGGYILAWAHVSANGHVYSGSRGATVEFGGLSPGGLPAYTVRWRGVKLPRSCAPIATLGEEGPANTSGVTSILTLASHGAGPSEIFVDAKNASGQLVPADFYLAVVC